MCVPVFVCVRAGNWRIGPLRAGMLPLPVNNTGQISCGVGDVDLASSVENVTSHLNHATMLLLLELVD